MRRSIALLAGAVLVMATATPVNASPNRHRLDGPAPAIWLSDPDGIDGDNGTERGDSVVGSRGRATVSHNKGRVAVRATGLVPGHVYTMWIVYFNDQTLCDDGCNGADLVAAGGGVIWGDGSIANGNGKALFHTVLRTGDGAEYVGETPPPPFAFAPYEANADNEFHVVIRSHGPLQPGEVWDQLTTFEGGCEVEVGPAPEEVEDFPVPLAPGECGDIQLYVFS